MKWCLIVIMGIFLFVTSCATTAKSPEVGYQSVASQEKIVYLRGDGKGSDLDKYLKVVKELSKYDENGLFTAIVVFNNSRYEKGLSPYLVCDVQFVFLDDSGIETEKTNWQPVMFEAGVDVTVKQISMNPATKEYKVYVRDPKTTKW
jgi:uncharacterized protein YcfL